jgi:hypothetical protein
VSEALSYLRLDLVYRKALLLVALQDLQERAYVSVRQRTSAYVSIRQHTSAYVSIRQHTSAYVSIRQHTSAYVSIRQHTSAYLEELLVDVLLRRESLHT